MTMIEVHQQTDNRVDFMAHGYALIGEPLNLLENGQRWFSEIYEREIGLMKSTGLVLGATSWMAELLLRTQNKVLVADLSPLMIDFARRELSSRHASVDFVRANWLDLPSVSDPLGVVLADNSFSFLPYPDGWIQLRDDLAGRMERGARLFARFLSMPGNSRSLPVHDLVRGFMERETVNWTEVRAALLGPLFQKFGLPIVNDLYTIEKYRGSGAIYYAPLPYEIAAIFEPRFEIRGIHFGPYGMSERFQLIVASLR